MADLTSAQLFLLEEYKALRSEVDHHLKAVIQVELAVVGGVAAIFAFAHSEGANENSLFAMPFLVILGAAVSIPHFIRTKTIGRYIARIEAELASGFGWEHELDTRASTALRIEIPQKLQAAPFILLSGCAWILLFIGSIILLLLGGENA